MALRSPILSRVSRIFATVVLPLALVGSGCSSSDSGSKKKKKSSDSAQAAETGKSGGGKKSDEAKSDDSKAGDTKKASNGKALDIPVWWAGAKYTLGAMNYDKENTTLTIEVDVENLLSQSQSPSPTLVLQADGAVISRGGLKEAKEIVAKSKVKNQIRFENLENFDASKTTMFFGEGDKQQAKIPLSGSGPNVTLQPVSLGWTGDIVIGKGTFSVQASEIRWDDVPHGWDEPKKDKAYLVLTGKLKNTSDDSDLGITTEKFALTQPDNTKVTADQSGPENMVAKTKTMDGFYVLFTIDAKDGHYAGDYTLDVTEDWGAEGASVSATPVKLTAK